MNKKIEFPHKRYKLNNGLDVILYKDTSTPLVAVNLWYRVGSANEEPGRTGFAHLFEHMMFQGSLNIPKEMHFKYVQEAGGSVNGSTSFDRTNYYETLPSNFLELGLWLESDRMGNFIPALTEEKLRNQKDVVMNERKQNYDNQPYGLAWEKLFMALFPEDHPYHFPTIGKLEDIENFRLDEVTEFFKKYYVPDNASLVIAGDIDFLKTEEMIEKYFGDIPRGNTPQPPESRTVILPEIKQIEYQDNVELDRLYLAFHSSKLYSPDDAGLDVIAELLSGSKNSRLYKNLVFDKQIALDVSAHQFSSQLNGLFFIVATARPGVQPEDLKTEILNEIKLLVENGCSDNELEKIKNSIISNFIYSLQNITSVANQMNNYFTNLGNPDSFEYDVNRYRELNKENIREIAERYFSLPFVELKIKSRELCQTTV